VGVLPRHVARREIEGVRMADSFAVRANEETIIRDRRRAVKLGLFTVDANVVQPGGFSGRLVDRRERSGAGADVDVVADDRRRGEDSPSGVVLPKHCGENECQHRQLAFFFFGLPIFASSGFPIHRP
jgi:hypothetical protein